MPIQNILIMKFVALFILFIRHTSGEYFYFVCLIIEFKKRMNN